MLICHLCNRTGLQWEKSELGEGLLLVRCRACGGASWVAELITRLPE